MKMMCKVTLVLVVAVSIGWCSTAQAVHIPVVSVISYQEVGGGQPNLDANSLAGHEWTNIIDDSGMSGDTHTLADTSDNIQISGGMSDNLAGFTLEFDLGADTAVDEMWIWNQGETVFGLGMKRIFVDARPEANFGFNGVFDGIIDEADGTATNVVDKIIDFTAFVNDVGPPRYIRIHTAPFPEHNYSGGVFNSTGLGEVRFFEVGAMSCTNINDGGAGLIGDVNEDCYVNMLDFGILSENWLRCIDAADPGCENPPL